jgi:hypothetical protein
MVWYSIAVKFDEYFSNLNFALRILQTEKNHGNKKTGSLKIGILGFFYHQHDILSKE